MKPITSSENPKLKNAIRLKSSRGRRQQGRIIIFGVRETLRAIECQVKLEEVYVARSLIEGTEQRLVPEIESSCENVYELSNDLFEKIGYGDRHDGMVSVAKRPNTDLDQLAEIDDGLILVLESVENPGNLGAVIRTADAVSARAVIVADPLTDVFHPNCIRASMGCVFGTPTATENAAQIFSWLIERGFNLFAAVVDGDLRYDQADYSGPSAILLGNESTALTEQ